MSRKMLWSSLLMLACVMQSHASEPWLITPQEYAREQQAAGHEQEPATRAAIASPGAPEIRIVAPSANVASAPISIIVEFATHDAAQLDRDSLKVRYGLLRLDITDRVLERGKFDANRFAADNLQIPTGKHRLSISIADDRGRRRELQYSLTIE